VLACCLGSNFDEQKVLRAGNMGNFVCVRVWSFEREREREKILKERYRMLLQAVALMSQAESRGNVRAG